MSPRAGWAAAAGLVTVVALVLVGAVSRIGVGASGTGTAELRLSWRMRSEPDRVCRRRTPEELAQLPPHMRTEEVCERQMRPYRLRVTLGDSVIDDRLIVASGARGDRPLYVFAHVPVTSGQHHVRLEFTREGAETEEARARLALDTTLTFAPGRALVVTYDEEAGRLRVIGAP